MIKQNEATITGSVTRQ